MKISSNIAKRMTIKPCYHLANLVIWKRIHFPKNKNATDTSTTSRRLGMVDFYVFSAPVFIIQTSSPILKMVDTHGVYSDLMGFIVIQWDINGIYPMVMTNSLLLKPWP